MEYGLKVALLLWVPLGLVFLSLGLQFRKKKTPQKIGKILGLLGLITFGLSHLTVPSSPSAASSAMFVSVLPSIGLMLLGLYLALFSGDIPVRRFSPALRPFGLLMFLFGFALLESMHWHESSMLPSTTWDNETNKFWLIFRPTFLLSMSSFLLAGGYFVNLFGKRINQTSRVLFLTGGFSFMLMIISVLYDGTSTTSDEFHNSVLLSISDMLGFLSGIGLTVLLFTLTIWQFERKRLPLTQLPPPSQNQLEKASEIIQQNLRGGENE